MNWSSSRACFLALFFLALLTAGDFPARAQPASNPPHHFGVQDGHFALDGQPFQIISGEMHYARIPRAYWRNRLQMARAMGLNTISTYVFWNRHEQTQGTFGFSGQNDVAEFIREAQQEGLHVILRPGPYVCAEWEWGGYPAWLLAKKDLVVRSSNPTYMAAASTWMHRLGQELAPLQVGNGGPIIAVQVENEYGSFDKDHHYMEGMRQLLLDSGFTQAMLYTADGARQVPDGSLPELPAVINFGVGHATDSFRQLKVLRPNGPFMAGEYWDGWFDHWGEKHHTTSAQQSADELAWMLHQGYSVNLYMFHGGTSFGWMNGANFSSEGGYEPDVTSYDYDSPLSESGQPTPKYLALRQTISQATGITPPPVPAAMPVQVIGSFRLARAASLWSTLPSPVLSDTPKSMEELGQAYGYLLYRTFLPAGPSGVLVLPGLQDYAQVYMDGQIVGTLDRRRKQDRLTLTAHGNAQLDILIENTGRVNFSKQILHERVGISGDVTLAGTPLHLWQMYTLPMLTPDTLPFENKPCSGPCFYQGSFQSEASADSFLDVSSFHKGFVWLNGHPLGRIWDTGPQQTLYIPGPWLRKGSNDVVVFDLKGVPQPALRGLAHAVLDAPTPALPASAP